MSNSTNLSFKDFLWKEKLNRRLLIMSAILILLEFIVFKYFYPSAGFIDGDSYNYLDSAFWNKGINTYMVGYSMFLRLFSVFTVSDFILVAFQYLLIEFGALLLVFSIFYFFNPHKVIQYILLFFVVVNPLFLYMANYISSDGFFLGLSLIWFALLLWTINRPSLRLIIGQCLVLYLCFTVRYNALLYPFIFFIALLLTRTTLKNKFIASALVILLIGSFVVYNSNKYKELTGKWQYTAFSGWQLANNAMYAYKYVEKKDRKPVPAKFYKLDTMIRTYFDTCTNPFTHPEILLKASTVYMWDPRSPLYKYRNSLFVHDTTASELKRWASMGPFYAQYGLYIITQYPGYYFNYFVWPNTCKYYAPPVEFLDHYNSGEDSVRPPAVLWFEYPEAKRLVRTKTLSVNMLNYYPILTGVMNIIYLFTLLCLLNLKYFRFYSVRRSTILLITVFWLGNAAFTIFSSSAALRFQATPIILITLFAITMIDIMIKVAVEQEKGKQTKIIPVDTQENIQHSQLNNEILV